MVPGKVSSGDEITVPLETSLVIVLCNGTKLVLISTITCDGCIVEDMLPSANEVMEPLELIFNVEVTEVILKVPLYGELSLSVQSKVPHPSMVVFLTKSKGRPASAHCSRESEMFVADEIFRETLMAVLGNWPTSWESEEKI